MKKAMAILVGSIALGGCYGAGDAGASGDTDTERSSDVMEPNASAPRKAEAPAPTAHGDARHDSYRKLPECRTYERTNEVLAVATISCDADSRVVMADCSSGQIPMLDGINVTCSTVDDTKMVWAYVQCEWCQ